MTFIMTVFLLFLLLLQDAKPIKCSTFYPVWAKAKRHCAHSYSFELGECASTIYTVYTLTHKRCAQHIDKNTRTRTHAYVVQSESIQRKRANLLLDKMLSCSVSLFNSLLIQALAELYAGTHLAFFRSTFSPSFLHTHFFFFSFF